MSKKAKLTSESKDLVRPIIASIMEAIYPEADICAQLSRGKNAFCSVLTGQPIESRALSILLNSLARCDEIVIGLNSDGILSQIVPSNSTVTDRGSVTICGKVGLMINLSSRDIL